MGARVIAKYVKMPPTRVGVVLNLIRGRNVNEAFAILKYISRSTAEVINKVLKSTIASAENNHELGTNRLFVAEAHVGHGLTLKRFRLIDRGKASKTNKRTSSTTLVVKERT